MGHRSVQKRQITLANNIRLARSIQGLTQEKAALRASIDYKRWQKIETGQANITLQTLSRIAETLNVLPASLICTIWSKTLENTLKDPTSLTRIRKLLNQFFLKKLKIKIKGTGPWVVKPDSPSQCPYSGACPEGKPT